ncbi:filamentous hemagglutinin N-terminal domain-containing protein [Aliirhizobium terrae]|uniref:two-partner secretion domain-containing protein n=1 Tax=Terrirhizobium terrae TaxID=2926709 RepID=UPI002578FD79|nr:filamentous hemagglutinin N-terminal domain-containing protein [Rhizobium sp. CC-CFT758]WJH41205.1 filamentous hemagglutinin N-terminal domain-containing protein [Rhizobium sp. CC-CFT758]
MSKLTPAQTPANRKKKKRFAFSGPLLMASVSTAALFVGAPQMEARSLGPQAPAPSKAAIEAAQSGQREAARAARQAQNSLKRATMAIQAVQATQQAARDAAKSALAAIPSGVAHGLRPGGLQVGTGVSLADGTVNRELWRGADLPTEFADGNGRTQVGVKQTEQKAILTWDSFNVSERTDLTFDQKGNRDWVALNRVQGGASPSRILGNIKADGSVFVINQNGIIFGGASQVNVGALIASTAKISNEQFLNGGIYSSQTGSNWAPSFTDAAALLGNGTGGGVVKVEAGAQITTRAPASATSGGGFVLLMGGEVEQSGTITTQKGQTQLAAGDDFVLRRGYGTDANQFSTTRGNEIAPLFDAGSLAGLVRNNGMISSTQGDITLAGRTIEQNGVLLASTSVSARGTIHLLNSATDKLGSITLGADSLTTIIPELESKETALNSQRDALIAASEKANAARTATGPFNNLSLLADRLDQSRVEIVTGGNVTFKGAVRLAPDR